MLEFVTTSNLFLKWVLMNTLLGVFLVFGGIQYHSTFHGATLVVVPLILAIYVRVSYFGGKLCRQVDGNPKPFERDRILHDAKWLDRFAYTSQILGIMSTMVGFYMILQKNGSEAGFSQRLQGGSVALLGSFIGVLCSLLILAQHWLIEHELEN